MLSAEPLNHTVGDSARRLCCERVGRQRRAGVSLLEVLIAIFVIMVGLLGVAAVIPVARLEMVQAAKADRAAACGRAVTEQLQTARALAMSTWWWYYNPAVNPPSNPLPAAPADFWRNVADLTYDPAYFHRSFVIDPCFYAQQSRYDIATPNTNNCYSYVSWIPYRREMLPAVPSDPVELTLRRVTLQATWSGNPRPMCWDRAYSGQSATLNPGFAGERLGTWQDDLTLPVPKDLQQRPRQMFRTLEGASVAYPEVPLPASPAVPLVRDNAGDYSWMITVTPEIPRDGNATAASLANCENYLVSTVVFYKRDTSPFASPDGILDQRHDSQRPSERCLSAKFLGDGWGGGDVLLYGDSRCNLSDANDGGFNARWLEVKENDWIMLFTGKVWVNQNADPDNGFKWSSDVKGVVLRWYRVVSVADVGTDNKLGPCRVVTLAGPDWRFGRTTDQGMSPPEYVWRLSDAKALLMDNIVGVYTTSVKFRQSQ